MMIASLSLLATVAMATQDIAPTSCPVMGAPAKNASAGLVDYNGVRYMFCCGGCAPSFKNNPTKFLAAAKDKTLGTFLFDPTTQTRITKEQAKAHRDYMGVRYLFASTEGATLFDKNPKQFATLPTKEVMVCPVTGEKVPSYAEASHYIDFEGVRYYTCCGGCITPLKQDPKKYISALKAKPMEPKAIEANEKMSAKMECCEKEDKDKKKP